MKRIRTTEVWSRLLLIFLLLLPLVLLFFAPAGGPFSSGWMFWLVLVLCFWLIWSVLGPPAGDKTPQPEVRMLSPGDQPEPVRAVMDVRFATEESGMRLFRGKLLVPAAAAYQKLKAAFRGQAVPMIQPDEKTGAAVVLMPVDSVEAVPERRGRAWVPWVLLVLTAITTTWAGAAHQGIDLLREPGRYAVGLPYAMGLLAILGVHELGHYFTARRHGIRVTPPYFIPVPFALGTFGAFIQMRAIPENRRALFDVAVAGPLAGLAVAIPALLVGLRSSVVLEPGAAVDTHMGGVSIGSSLLFAMLSKLSLGGAAGYGHVLRLSPLAFAGWLGLFITALNLLPIGQLDGGHIARAMFGSRAGSTISTIAMWSLFLLALFVWPGLIMWAVIVFFIAGAGAPPLEDFTSLTPGRRRLGYATFAILALILIPLPHPLWQTAGIHCPYL